MNHDKETLEAAETYAKKNGVLIGKREVFTVDVHLGNPQQFENIYELNKEAYWAFLAGVAYAREKRGKQPNPTLWYVDRDFPEVKVSNSKIVGVAENREQAQKIADEHNQSLNHIVQDWAKLKRQLAIAKGALERLEAGFAGMFGHQSVSPQQDFYDRGEQFVIDALKKLKELEAI